MRKKVTYLVLALLIFSAAEFNYCQTTSTVIYKTEEAKSVSTENSTLKSSTRVRTSNNYFRVERSKASLWNGKYWKSTDFPLKVYVEQSNSKLYKPLYKSYIDYAFKVWQKADSRIKFVYVSSKEHADITIAFEDNLSEKYKDNYLGLTDYELTRTNKIINSAIQISFLRENGEKLNNGELKATIIHELGHAVGLGHSDNKADIMYPFIDPAFNSEMDYNDLTTGDESSVKSLMDIGFKFQYSQM